VKVTCPSATTEARRSSVCSGVLGCFSESGCYPPNSDEKRPEYEYWNESPIQNDPVVDEWNWLCREEKLCIRSISRITFRGSTFLLGKLSKFLNLGK